MCWGIVFCKEVVGQLLVLHIDTFLSLPKLLWLFNLERANDLFHDLNICVVTISEFLKAFVGEQSLVADFVSNTAVVWCKCIQSHYDVFVDEPQASVAAFARSLQFEWNLIQWIILECGTLFSLLQHVINSIFICWCSI